MKIETNKIEVIREIEFDLNLHFDSIDETMSFWHMIKQIEDHFSYKGNRLGSRGEQRRQDDILYGIIREVKNAINYK